MSEHWPGNSGPFCANAGSTAKINKAMRTRSLIFRWFIFFSSKFSIPKNEVAEGGTVLLSGSQKSTKAIHRLHREESADGFVILCTELDLDRQDHRHTLLVVPVLIAVGINQVLLLELYRYEDERSRGDGKNQMRQRHRRRFKHEVSLSR